MNPTDWLPTARSDILTRMIDVNQSRTSGRSSLNRGFWVLRIELEDIQSFSGHSALWARTRMYP